MPDLLSRDDLSRNEESLSRRERERLRRRRAMLRAAQAVFAEKGYAQATLGEIAERAEFGKGTLYNYFEGGKEDLLFAVFDEVYDGIFGLVERFMADAEERPLREAFEAFVREAFDFFLERKSLFMMIVKESHQFIFGEDQERAAYFHAQENRLVQAMLPTLRRAAEAGEIRPMPARPLAHLMIENTKGLIMARAMMNHAEGAAPEADSCQEDLILYHPGRAADMLATLFFDGLAPGATAPSETSSAPAPRPKAPRRAPD